MISRLTATATLFAVLATATLTFAAQSPAADTKRSAIAAPAEAAMPIVVMPRVEVTGKRAR